MLGPATVLALALLTGCAPSLVQIEEHEMTAEDAAACKTLVDDLPDTLSGELRRSVDPDDALGAAWGEDTPYVLTCGVPEPKDVPDDATCLEFGHQVGWYVPEDQLKDLRVDVVATTLTHEPRVSLQVPAGFRRNGFDTAVVELAPILGQHLELVEPCL